MATFKVLNRVKGIPTSDGAGVRLNRVIGTDQLKNLDPFLMLDEFRSASSDDYIAGFPPHPHRGFETITYMLQGAMKHEDHLGNVGVLTGGGVQWMTAGAGIIHSEMPMQKDGLLWGFQFWLNLPAAEKMKAPFYQDLAPEEIPEIEDGNGVLRRVVAGVSKGVSGPVQREATHPLMVDFRISQPTAFEHDLPEGHQSFIYVYEGGLEVPDAGITLEQGELLAFTGNLLRLKTKGKSGVLLVSGKPLQEPIVQYGPFVMNTAQEIQQAIEDYRSGSLAKEARQC